MTPKEYCRRKVTTETCARDSRRCSYGMTIAGNFATAILALLLFLKPYCHCMPISIPEEREDTAVREAWWDMPCDIQEELTTKRQPAGPGGQLKSWRRTQTQINLARIHYKGLGLKEMYSEVVGVLDKAYNYNWLPQNQIEWFKKEFGKFEDIKKVGPKVLIALRVALGRFAVTLDRLYHHRHGENEHHQFNRQRREIFVELRNELKKVLCEVDQSLSVGGHPPSPPIGADVIPNGSWDNRPDKTAVIVQDWGVLSTYGSFLDEWTSIVEELLKSASNGKRRNRGKKQKGHKNGRKGRGSKGQRNGSKETQRSSEEGEDGERDKNGRKPGAGARKKMRGGNSGAGERRVGAGGGKGRRRGEKKQEQ